MKPILIVTFLLSVFSTLSWGQESNDFRPAETNVWGAEYPRVDNTGRVQIRVKAPEANKVKLNFWSGPKVDMEKQPDGFWTVTTPPLWTGCLWAVCRTGACASRKSGNGPRVRA